MAPFTTKPIRDTVSGEAKKFARARKNSRKQKKGPARQGRDGSRAMYDPDEDFNFLDKVVEAFGDAAKQLIADAESMKDLDSICYGSLLAACILHCEKHGIDDAENAVLAQIREIFAERREREDQLSAPTDATLH